MAENPLAIRTSEDVKALFNELAESGDFENKGEFLNRLLISYQAESAKKDVSMMKPAIETVETLTSRLLEVLNGTAAITTKDEKQKQELDEQKKSFEETRTLLQQRISSLEQDRAEDEERIQLFIKEKETAENKTGELLQQIKQLENSVNDKTALIEEYKSKNDTLNSIISEYKTAADENKNLIDTVNNLKHVNIEQQRRIDELTKELQQQAETLKVEQDNLKKSLLIDKDTALLELRTEHQRETQQQQELYNDKVKSLLERLEASQTTTLKAQTASNKKAPANKKSATGTESTN